MKQTVLNSIFYQHKLWLNDSSRGKRADLSHANLSHVNLHGADLSEANFIGADLSCMNLSKVNLFKADLSRVNLYNTIITFDQFQYIIQNFKDVNLHNIIVI